MTTAAGTDSLGTFTVTVAAPTITSFSPTTGKVGTSVEIIGTNFTGTTVRFGAVSAAFVVNSLTRITATVPAGAGTGQITVTTNGGTATSAGTFVREGRLDRPGSPGGSDA